MSELLSHINIAMIKMSITFISHKKISAAT